MKVKISTCLYSGNARDDMWSEAEAIKLAEELISDIHATSNERFQKIRSAAWRHYWKSNFGHTIRITVERETHPLMMAI